MSTKKGKLPTAIPLLRVRQWLPNWDEIHFDKKARQTKPEPDFFLCGIKAGDLKALTGVYRRSTKGGIARAKDPNVQRGHEQERSATIRDYVRFGYPWCEMGEKKREMPDAMALRKPGWLPTAIIVNILPSGAERNGKVIAKSDLVTVEASNGATTLNLPAGFTGPGWEPETIFPIEVIDGQHRLWAFEGFNPGDDFELPVVAFHGLDHSWQAYLFWSVNITPKRINRSLAFDLYPLLRREDWLEKFAGHSIYRETRCQELVECLWSHPDSPWHQRINMLGETAQQLGSESAMATQAAWIRSLMATFVKQWEGSNVAIGGLFGAPRATDDTFLPWNRAMQAAFLIFVGNALKDAVARTKTKWAQHLRQLKEQEDLFDGDDDAAFYGKHSLLTTDQGIRGILFVFNDLCYVQASELNLEEWQSDEQIAPSKRTKAPATEENIVSTAIQSLSDTAARPFVMEIAKGLSTYDWRTSSTPGLVDSERLKQAVFRGSSGYKELRKQLLEHLAEAGGTVASAAKTVSKTLGYS